MTNYTSWKTIGNKKWRRNLSHIARTLFLTWRWGGRYNRNCCYHEAIYNYRSL